MDERLITDARLEDAAEIQKIYAHYVKQTAVSFEYVPPDVLQIQGRMAKIMQKHPYLVAKQDGHVVGYSYASVLKERAAYDWAVETSIYVRQDCRGKGIGKTLYAALEAQLCRQGILNLYACIADTQENDPFLTRDSIVFHERQGYHLAGRFCKCGYKFGRWYDMVWMEKTLGAHCPEQQPVIWQSELVQNSANK